MQLKLINVNELAKVLGISVQTVYAWVSRRRLPIVKVGRRTMFNPEEIDRWVRVRSRREVELQQIEDSEITTIKPEDELNS